MASNPLYKPKTSSSKLEAAQPELNYQRNLFQALCENLDKEVHLWKVIKNDDHEIIDWELEDINTLALRSWQKKMSEVKGKMASELFGDETITQFKAIIHKIFTSNKPHSWTQYFEQTKRYLFMKNIPVGNYFIAVAQDITENITRDFNLEKGSNLLSAIFDNTFNFTSLLEIDGSIINVNKSTLVFSGFEKEKVLGKKYYDIPWWAYRKDTQSELKHKINLCAQGEFVRYEMDIKTNDNRIITVDFSLKPVFDDQKKVIYIIQEGRDITEKELIKNEIKALNTALEKKVKERTSDLEKALDQVEEYKIAAELSHVGIWKWNLKTNVQYWDNIVYQLYGVQKEKVKSVTEACFNGIHIDDRERVRQEFRDTMNGLKPFDSIFRVIQQNSGKTIYVRAKGKVDLDEQGVPDVIYGTKWDVSKEMAISEERNQLSQELEQQYQLISAASNIVIADHQGIIIEVNKAFCETSGYDQEDLLNRSFGIVLHEDFAPDYIESLTKSLIDGENWSGVLCSRKKDGTVYWQQTTISPFKNTDGSIEKFVSVGFDISDQKKLELRAKDNQKQSMQQSRELMKLSKELSRQKYLLQTVFDNTDFMIFLKDMRGKFILVNKQLCSNLNMGEVEDVIGTSDFDYFAEEEAQAFREKDQEIIDSGIVQTFEEEIMLPIGKRTFLTSKFPIRDYSYKKMGICGISIDITDKKDNENKLKEAQAQLIQSEKLASLGMLTAGIAHEINNPLNYISGGYQAIKRHIAQNEIPDMQSIEQFLDWIKIGTERTTNIVRGLNDLSRDNIDFDEDCDLTIIINDTLSVLGNRLDSRITLSKKIDTTNTIIKGNIGKLFQLFLNIFTNAIDAIENNGNILINLSQDDKYINVQIEDSGSGIEQKDLNKVFEPFYTTKSPGKGTGLGLFISNNIVKEHKGYLEIHSKLGTGTTIKIHLPK